MPCQSHPTAATESGDNGSIQTKKHGTAEDTSWWYEPACVWAHIHAVIRCSDVSVHEGGYKAIQDARPFDVPSMPQSITTTYIEDFFTISGASTNGLVYSSRALEKKKAHILANATKCTIDKVYSRAI